MVFLGDFVVEEVPYSESFVGVVALCVMSVKVRELSLSFKLPNLLLLKFVALIFSSSIFS